MIYRKLYILLIFLLLNNCGTRDFFGFEEPEIKLQGERVSILKDVSKKNTEALSTTKVILKNPTVNLTWTQSYNSPTHLSDNFKSTSKFNSLKRLVSGYSEDKESKILAQPLVMDNNIFFMDGKGVLYCFDIKQRRSVWRKKITDENEKNHNIGGGFALLNDKVIINSAYGDVIALSIKNGSILWKKNVFSPLRSAPTIYKNNILSLTLDNKLIVINSENGDTLWEHEGVINNTTIMGSPKVGVDDNIIIVPYSNGDFYALNYSNGLVLWKNSFLDIGTADSTNAFTDIDANPVIFKNKVFLASSLGKVIAIDKRTGNRIWMKDITTTKTPLVYENSMFIIDNNKNIINLDINNGSFRWLTKIKEEFSKDYYNIWHAPILINNKLLIVGGDKKFLIVNPISGKIEKVKKLSSLAASSPFVANEKVYLMLRNGDIATIE